jgi:CRISPR-associated protein Csx10
MADATELQVTVRARQRVALGVGSEVGYFTGSHEFVPGSVLRGALAAAWIAEYGPPSRGNSYADRFRELFDGAIRYGPLYAAGSEVIPVSAWLCKYPAGQDCGRQAADAAFETVSRCAACGGPLEQGKGQVRLPPDISMERIARTSIDQQTARAKDGELYGHAALPAGTIFQGVIHGDDPWLRQARPLRIGGRRTVGGAASYSSEPAAPLRTAGPLGSDGMLTVRLASPAIFVDAAGRPRTELDPMDLDGAVLTAAWVRPVTWTGWHAASGLPKPEEQCVVAGSTYRLAGTPEVLRRLARQLQCEGIGLRRGEGFGAAEAVTVPWRPAARVEPSRSGESAEKASLGWYQAVYDLKLSAPLRRWVVSGLRDLQHHRVRHPAGSDEADWLTSDLLGRPAANELSGHQRDKLRDLFAEARLDVLREVTALLAADVPGGTEGGEE